jgi:DNA-binding CsgD family transcriptional regulator
MATVDAAIVGREEELDRVSRFVLDTDRLPAVLVLEGEAGIGKTTLWQAGLEAAEAEGHRVLRCTPSQAEAHLAFAAVADLLARVDDDTLAALPNVQRRALMGAVLLRSDDESVDRRAIATAFLGVLRELAASGPLLVAVDDAQWLDAESALLLSFAARRLTSEVIGFVLSQRSAAATKELDLGASVQRIAVEPLSLGAVHRLLRGRLGAPVPRPLLRRIHEISGGNPFFALELASAVNRGSASTELTLPTSLERLVQARLRVLPQPTREALAELSALPDLATAEPDPNLVTPAVDAGILRQGTGGLEFVHPLLRAAAYAHLTPGRRRGLHRRLADATTDVEERAQHLALAADEPDEGVAAMIEKGAERAKRRGAPAVAAELLDHAIRLTEDEQLGVRRTLRAATMKVESGDLDGARAALETLLADLTEGPVRAEALALLADDIGVGVDHGVELATEGLRQSGIGDALRARLLLALSDNVFLQNDLTRSAEHAAEALTAAESSGDDSVLARATSWNGQLAALTGGCEPGPLFARASRIERRLAEVDPWRAAGHWHGVSLMWADRVDEGRRLLAEQYERAAALGNEFARSGLCFHLTQLECRAGDFARAGQYAREGHNLATLIGDAQLGGILLYARTLVAAHMGDTSARSLAEEALASTADAGDEFFAIHERVVLGFLEASLGDYVAAHEYLGGLAELLDKMGLREPGVFPFHGDEIEALVALGELEAAAELIASVESQGRDLSRPRLLALAWRGRGMLEAARGEAAKAADAFARALAEHERLELPLERGRTLIAYGVALRRGRQKRSARTTLEEAAAIFEALGAQAWLERARNELARVSGRAPSRGELTPTERRVAQLAAAGKANKEIAAELYVTVRTVETHLTKIYEKLAIRSRGGLARRLPEAVRDEERSP